MNATTLRVTHVEKSSGARVATTAQTDEVGGC